MVTEAEFGRADHALRVEKSVVVDATNVLAVYWEAWEESLARCHGGRYETVVLWTLCCRNTVGAVVVGAGGAHDTGSSTPHLTPPGRMTCPLRSSPEVAHPSHLWESAITTAHRAATRMIGEL